MRWALRYNTITLTESSWSFLDIHGNQASDFHAVQGVEVYGNYFVAGSERGEIMDHRGGQLMMFFNNFETTAAAPSMETREENADSNSPPANNVITGQPQHIWNSYYWANRKNAIGGDFGYYEGAHVGDIPLVDRDYWKDTTWQADGSSGVGCGTVAQMLAITTCSEGVGFWATTQSCDNLTGLVGANSITPIQLEFGQTQQSEPNVVR